MDLGHADLAALARAGTGRMRRPNDAVTRAIPDCICVAIPTCAAALPPGSLMGLWSVMAAEHDSLSEIMTREVHAFADVDVAWIRDALAAAALADSLRRRQGKAMLAGVTGAQLIAGSRADLAVYEDSIELPHLGFFADLSLCRSEVGASSVVLPYGRIGALRPL